MRQEIDFLPPRPRIERMIDDKHLQPRDPEDWHKIWTTGGSESEQNRLYEFADEDKYRKVRRVFLGS